MTTAVVDFVRLEGVWSCGRLLLQEIALVLAVCGGFGSDSGSYEVVAVEGVFCIPGR